MFDDGLSRWVSVGRVTDALKATRDRDASKVMIAKSRSPD